MSAKVEPEAVYRYTDAAGELLFEKVRLPGKDFRQRRPDGNGGYVWNLNGVEQVLYRLPAVSAHLKQGLAAPIYVVEGEKDADAIAAAGATATTNSGGAGKWREEHTEALTGARHVIVIADKDEIGRKHAREVADALRPVVDLVEVVQAAEGKDTYDHLAFGHDLDDLVPLEEVDADDPEPEPPIVFATLREFLETEFPNPEPLIGRPGQRYLAASSLFLVYGEEGAAKTTWTMDGVAHLGAGVPWLGLEVERAVRFCLIENESAPGLLQETLAAKAASWEGETDWIANVAVFETPWGGFSFKDEGARRQLRDYCCSNAIDFVVANPLLGLGASGSGRPEETAAFVEWLKECGLWRDLGFWLLHHENKAGQISGDWGRHPDTVVLLERDGNRPRTKLTWAKTRWASTGVEGQPRTLLLDWVVETKSYTVVEADTLGVSDSELAERLDEFLAANPGSSTKAVYLAVKGEKGRLRRLLDEGVEANKYGRDEGSRGALLWSLAGQVSTTSLFAQTDTSGHVDGKPHE
jgi:hypothetical protein